MMKTRGIVVLVYAVFVLLGGLIGFAKVHSIPSLVMGVTFALALSASAIAMLKEIWIGYYFSVIFTLILSVFFTYRLVLTQKFMPAGLMCILSVVVLATLFINKKKS